MTIIIEISQALCIGDEPEPETPEQVYQNDVRNAQGVRTDDEQPKQT